jgi:hypothetical protein
VTATADIPREEEAKLPLGGELLDIEHDLSGAKDVPSIDKSELHAVRDRHRPTVSGGYELAKGTIGIDGGVEWFRVGLAVATGVLAQPTDVVRLDLGAILKHDLADVPGGVGGVDVPGEAPSAEVGEIATVIDVGVGQDHAVDLCGIEGKVEVALVGLRPMPLEETAIEENALAVDLKEVLRTGGGLGGAAEGDLHMRGNAPENTNTGDFR